MMSAISVALWLMYLEECSLNANVVVEHTQGRPCLAAASLPQKHAESVTTTSGRQDATSSDTTGSRFATVRNDCTLISVVDTLRSRFSAFLSIGGRKESQATNWAPASSILSRNSSNE